MLCDSERREKPRIMRQNFRRRMTAIKFTKQAGDGLDHKRIRVANEKTIAGAKLRNEPQLCQTTGNEVRIRALLGAERWTLLCFLYQIGQAVLSILQRGQLCGKSSLFFREVHGAEMGSIHRFWRLCLFWRARRFVLPLHILGRFVLRTTWLFVARAVFPMAALLLLIPRTALLMLRLVTLRLDTAQGTAELFNFAFISKFLTLRDLN